MIQKIVRSSRMGVGGSKQMRERVFDNRKMGDLGNCKTLRYTMSLLRVVWKGKKKGQAQKKSRSALPNLDFRINRLYYLNFNKMVIQPHGW